MGKRMQEKRRGDEDEMFPQNDFPLNGLYGLVFIFIVGRERGGMLRDDMPHSPSLLLRSLTHWKAKESCMLCAEYVIDYIGGIFQWALPAIFQIHFPLPLPSSRL